MIYRIYLGLPKNEWDPEGYEVKKWIKEKVAPKLLNFTIIPTQGFWDGKFENSLILEIIKTGEYTFPKNLYEELLEDICTDYCTEFKQEAVLLTKTENTEIKLYGSKV